MNAALLTHRSRQRGVVLVISLLLLLVLTMLGLAATRGTTLEQRMTTNQNDQEVAFQAAEAALRAGESQLSSAGLNYNNNTAGAYNLTTMGDVNWKTIDWSPGSGAVLAYGAGIQPTPIVAPSYFIVYDTTQTASGSGTSISSNGSQSSNLVYHVYARGVGLTGNTAVILESSYLISTGI